MPVAYRTTAISTGNGRNGRARTTDGVLDLALTPPTPRAAPGDPTNPEQLFAAGYSACFHSAVKGLAKAAGVDIADSSIRVEIGLVKSDSGYSLQAAITGELPGVDRAIASDLLARAHQRCPYSKATNGNVDVTPASSYRFFSVGDRFPALQPVAELLRRDYLGPPELTDISDRGGWRAYRQQLAAPGQLDHA